MDKKHCFTMGRRELAGIIMANISVTLLCNRKCSYCFAESIRKKKISHEQFMSRETFLMSLDFLKRSHIKHVKLLGGEPSLHPCLSWFIEKSLEENFKVIIFSNGLMNKKLLSYLKTISHENITVIVNINSPEEQQKEEREKQELTLKELSEMVTPCFNMHNTMADPSFLIELIEKYNLGRNIRLGLAHPCLDYNNSCIHQKNYEKAGSSIADFFELCLAHKIILNFDCGFVPCMFPEGFIEVAHIHPVPLGLHCGPMPDIMPDGSIVPCYGLASRWHLTLDESITAMDCQEIFNKELQMFRMTGIYKKCEMCKWMKMKKCRGGCLSAAIKRMRNFPEEL